MPYFSSGPTTKRPGWNPSVLQDSLTGRSHRSSAGILRIREVLTRTRDILKIPENYHLAMVAGSATGALEMAFWNLLGSRGIDALAWDVFGHRWQLLLLDGLKLSDIRSLNAPEGQISNLGAVDFDRDVVFLWNGSTSGVRVPDGEWIPDNRKGLTICDATSAVFTTPIPWEKLDAIAFSWQKGLGSEAGHGMLVLGPRAVERLESTTPPWPVPGLYQLRENGKFFNSPFNGLTTNTPSMLCIEDCLDALKWAKDLGGLSRLVERSTKNLAEITNWTKKHPWIQFLAQEEKIRSSSTICLKVLDPKGHQETRWEYLKQIASILETRGVALDFLNHAYATPCFRFWGGPTVETSDLSALPDWLDWARTQAYEHPQPFVP